MPMLTWDNNEPGTPLSGCMPLSGAVPAVPLMIKLVSRPGRLRISLAAFSRPAAAFQQLIGPCPTQPLVAMGERGNRSSLVTYLAEAASPQGRFDQALRLTEEAEAPTRPVVRPCPTRDTTCHHVQCVPKS